MTRRNWLLSLVPAALLTVVVGLGAAPALAHGDTKPKHGGIVQLIGETLFELVAKPDGAEIYLVEDHEDAVAADFTGKIKVLSAGVSQDVALVPGAGNKFTAPGVKLASGARAIVTLKRTLSGATVSARFSIP